MKGTVLVTRYKKIVTSNALPISTPRPAANHRAQVWWRSSFKKTILSTCVCRYLPPCTKIREIIDSGALGEVVTIDHAGEMKHNI